MDVSICISTRNKDKELDRVLDSISTQNPPLDFEVIVVDDGSSDDTEEICDKHISQGLNLDYSNTGRDFYGNPAIARNIAYKKARGKVIIAQSDEVFHGGSDTIEKLADIATGTFNIATVWNVACNAYGKVVRRINLFTSESYPRPLFFLGSLYREDIYKIGGNAEEFTEPGYEDDWFAQCLIHGLKLAPIYRPDILGYHQRHARPSTMLPYQNMKILFNQKFETATARDAEWIGGPAWPYEE